eukprot:scaffold145_cov261-Pinguiococcus_pyrenoidosus.AAC.3
MSQEHSPRAPIMIGHEVELILVTRFAVQSAATGATPPNSCAQERSSSTFRSQGKSCSTRANLTLKSCLTLPKASSDAPVPAGDSPSPWTNQRSASNRVEPGGARQLSSRVDSLNSRLSGCLAFVIPGLRSLGRLSSLCARLRFAARCPGHDGAVAARDTEEAQAPVSGVRGGGIHDLQLSHAGREQVGRALRPRAQLRAVVAAGRHRSGGVAGRPAAIHRGGRRGGQQDDGVRAGGAHLLGHNLHEHQDAAARQRRDLHRVPRVHATGHQRSGLAAAGQRAAQRAVLDVPLGARGLCHHVHHDGLALRSARVYLRGHLVRHLHAGPGVPQARHQHGEDAQQLGTRVLHQLPRRAAAGVLRPAVRDGRRDQGGDLEHRSGARAALVGGAGHCDELLRLARAEPRVGDVFHSHWELLQAAHRGDQRVHLGEACVEHRHPLPAGLLDGQLFLQASALTEQGGWIRSVRLAVES